MNNRSKTQEDQRGIKDNMHFSVNLLQLCLLLHSIILSSAQTQPSSRSHACSPDNYTTTSTYRSNLNLLISSLTSNATVNGGFYNDSVGQTSSTTVNGLFLCRGDITPQECQTCVRTAYQDLITNLCPNAVGAITWYDLCMVRYTDQPIFSKLETRPGSELFNIGDHSDPVALNRTLGNLMDELVREAISRSSDPRGYAIGDEKVNDFDRVYAMVQCTPDLSSKDCEVCLRDTIGRIPGCCNGKIGATIFRPSCISRFEPVPFIDEYRNRSSENNNTSAPPPKEANDDNGALPNGGEGGSPSSRSINIVAIVIPAVIGSIFLLAILVYLLMINKSRRKRRANLKSKMDEEMGNGESLQFDLDTIKLATDNFSSGNKLGEGGFGAVYKGKLINGQEIAVKRLSINSGQGSQEFKNEVMLLHKLQHRNLVRLLGFCLEGEEKLLIYEFVTNRSLDKYLFDPTRKVHLDWRTRYKIIGGIARGLLYLHEDSRLRIIHRDLKAGNILLDGEMNPKISDFGMAKLFALDQTRGNTSRIAGTFGYMAPEYVLQGLFSVKSDVFSFGVLLLEIISGQKITNYHSSGPSKDLLSIAWKHWREGTSSELVDPALGADYCLNEVMRCIHIGLLCVMDNEEERPTMSTVVLMLNSFSLTLPCPSPPAFFTGTTTGSNGNANSGAGEWEYYGEESTTLPLNDIREGSLDLGRRSGRHL